MKNVRMYEQVVMANLVTPEDLLYTNEKHPEMQEH